MLLSVIIPVYNVEVYLRECVNSVLMQDLTDCEVIAVDDGSTDDSSAILEEYVSRYPELLKVVTKQNGGLSSARNAGVRQATGDYIYFLDSDDFLKPHAIESIRKAIAASENADVIYLDCIVTDQGVKWNKHLEQDAPSMTLRKFFLYAYEHNINVAPNAVSYVYSNSYWRKCDFHFMEGIKYEDALFNYQLFVRDDGIIKTIHVEEPFYVYRIGREGSISTKLTLKNFMDKQFIRKSADKLWSGLGINDIAYYHVLFEECTYMLYEAYTCGLIKKSRMFWDREDVCIMRKGVSNEREYGFWLLAKVSPKWMARYYINDLPTIKRKLTNRFLSIFRHACSYNNFKNEDKGNGLEMAVEV